MIPGYLRQVCTSHEELIVRLKDLDSHFLLKCQRFRTGSYQYQTSADKVRKFATGSGEKINYQANIFSWWAKLSQLNFLIFYGFSVSYMRTLRGKTDTVLIIF